MRGIRPARLRRDGTGNTEMFDLTGFETANSYYGIDADGMVFYNHNDRSASEIWLVAAD